MKYLLQFLRILCISFVGEGLRLLLPFPIPGSIYGMLLLFFCLMAGVIRLEQVRDTGKFLLEIMPVMFIPAGVGLMTSFETLEAILVPVIVITVAANVTVMLAVGWVSQLIIRRTGGKKHE